MSHSRKIEETLFKKISVALTPFKNKKEIDAVLTLISSQTQFETKGEQSDIAEQYKTEFIKELYVKLQAILSTENQNTYTQDLYDAIYCNLIALTKYFSLNSLSDSHSNGNDFACAQTNIPLDDKTRILTSSGYQYHISCFFEAKTSKIIIPANIELKGYNLILMSGQGIINSDPTHLRLYRNFDGSVCYYIKNQEQSFSFDSKVIVELFKANLNKHVVLDNNKLSAEQIQACDDLLKEASKRGHIELNKVVLNDRDYAYINSEIYRINNHPQHNYKSKINRGIIGTFAGLGLTVGMLSVAIIFTVIPISLIASWGVLHTFMLALIIPTIISTGIGYILECKRVNTINAKIAQARAKIQKIHEFLKSIDDVKNKPSSSYDALSPDKSNQIQNRYKEIIDQLCKGECTLVEVYKKDSQYFQELIDHIDKNLLIGLLTTEVGRNVLKVIIGFQPTQSKLEEMALCMDPKSFHKLINKLDEGSLETLLDNKNNKVCMRAYIASICDFNKINFILKNTFFFLDNPKEILPLDIITNNNLLDQDEKATLTKRVIGMTQFVTNPSGSIINSTHDFINFVEDQLYAGHTKDQYDKWLTLLTDALTASKSLHDVVVEDKLNAFIGWVNYQAYKNNTPQRAEDLNKAREAYRNVTNVGNIASYVNKKARLEHIIAGSDVLRAYQDEKSNKEKMDQYLKLSADLDDHDAGLLLGTSQCYAEEKNEDTRPQNTTASTTAAVETSSSSFTNLYMFSNNSSRSGMTNTDDHGNNSSSTALREYERR